MGFLIERVEGICCEPSHPDRNRAAIGQSPAQACRLPVRPRINLNGQLPVSDPFQTIPISTIAEFSSIPCQPSMGFSAPDSETTS